MALQVTLVKTPGGAFVSRTSHLFNEQGGTLGRAEVNTWQLPDPDKFLSSCHCEILCLSNSYYLVDCSTNGTFLNGSPEPIGRGSKRLLADGDMFEIGDYQFSVALTSAAITPGSPFDSDDAFFTRPNDQGHFESPFEHVPPNDVASIFDEQLDPLAIWDNAGKINEPRNHFAEVAPSILSSSIDDIFGTAAPHAMEDFGQVDLSQNVDQAVAWPDASRESLIPEDWEDDLLDIGAASFNERPPVASPIPIQAPPVVRIPQPHRTPVVSAKPAVVERQTLAERISQLEAVPLPPARPPLAVSPELPAIPVSETVVKPVIPAVTQVHGARPDCTLITAMGLDPDRLSDSDIAEINATAGRLMREIVEGMMGVLRSRTSIKNEFRMNVTTIQPVENNPLKFSVSVDDAIENMFLKKSNAYKKPVEAFREGFQEIAEHQVAMIGGIRQGFERMMERFNPENLEKSFNKQGRGGMIPGMQKAKYWNNYAEYYAGFADNMESSFQHLFGSDFVSAYEDQLRRLAAARKKDNK